MIKTNKMKTITIPENTRVIIDGDVIIFESKEPIYEIGKWYSDGLCTCLKISNGERGKSKAVGFASCGWSGDMVIISNNWQPADMKEVTRLLICEAEKRGYSVGSKIKYSATYTINELIYSIENNHFYIDGIRVFNSKTGKWAEIVQEEKPLWTNSYGTEWFKGDYPWEVVKKDLLIRKIDRPVEMIIDLDITLEEDEVCSEIMTERECHQYIADNWDKLKK